MPTRQPIEQQDSRGDHHESSHHQANIRQGPQRLLAHDFAIVAHDEQVEAFAFPGFFGEACRPAKGASHGIGCTGEQNRDGDEARADQPDGEQVLRKRSQQGFQ
jgi:hypothetical protein